MTRPQAPVALVPRWSYETTLAGEPGSASRARAFVARHLTEHRLVHLLDPVRLTASELATHAVVRQTPFTLRLSELEDVVVVTVRDGMARATAHAPADATTEARVVDALGLRIVELVSLDCGVEIDTDGVTTLWASFARRHGRRPLDHHRRG